jgi:hypothetical protein
MKDERFYYSTTAGCVYGLYMVRTVRILEGLSVSGPYFSSQKNINFVKSIRKLMKKLLKILRIARKIY